MNARIELLGLDESEVSYPTSTTSTLLETLKSSLPKLPTLNKTSFQFTRFLPSKTWLGATLLSCLPCIDASNIPIMNYVGFNYNTSNYMRGSIDSLTTENVLHFTNQLGFNISNAREELFPSTNMTTLYECIKNDVLHSLFLRNESSTPQPFFEESMISGYREICNPPPLFFAPATPKASGGATLFLALIGGIDCALTLCILFRIYQSKRKNSRPTPPVVDETPMIELTEETPFFQIDEELPQERFTIS